jgi:hypothetical protein
LSSRSNNFADHHCLRFRVYGFKRFWQPLIIAVWDLGFRVFRFLIAAVDHCLRFRV